MEEKQKNTKTKILIFSGIAVILVSVVLFIFIIIKPKFTYDIKTFPEGEKEEQPLQLSAENNSVKFSFSFTTGKDEVEMAFIQNSCELKPQPLFLTAASDILIKLKSSKNRPEEIEEYFLYEINGTISNLYSKEYKIRVEDAYGNLIDEKVVTVN